MGATAVLFDIGNVIVRWDPRTLYSKIFPDEAELDRFLSEVCPMSWHAEHDRGLPFADGIASRIAMYPQYADQIRAWKDRWPEMFSGAIPQTEAAIEALYARGVPLYGLTNLSTEVFDQVVALSPAFSRLRDIVISGAEKLIKPDPRLYALTCRRLGLAPSQILFIDDSPVNIEAARDFGMDVHLFADPAALAPALADRGLL